MPGKDYLKAVGADTPAANADKNGDAVKAANFTTRRSVWYTIRPLIPAMRRSTVSHTGYESAAWRALSLVCLACPSSTRSSTLARPARGGDENILTDAAGWQQPVQPGNFYHNLPIDRGTDPEQLSPIEEGWRWHRCFGDARCGTGLARLWLCDVCRRTSRRSTPGS